MEQIESIIRDAENMKQRAMLMGRIAKSGKLAKFDNTLATLAKADPANRSRYSWICGYDFQFNLYIRELTSFTEGAAVSILQVFEYMNPVSTKIHDNATYFTKVITYRFPVNTPTDEEPEVTAEVQIELTVKKDSTECRRVQIGMTDPKPYPIYALDCDPAPAEAAQGE